MSDQTPDRKPIKSQDLFDMWRSLHPSPSMLQSIEIVEAQTLAEEIAHKKSSEEM